MRTHPHRGGGMRGKRMVFAVTDSVTDRRRGHVRKRGTLERRHLVVVQPRQLQVQLQGRLRLLRHLVVDVDEARLEVYVEAVLVEHGARARQRLDRDVHALRAHRQHADALPLAARTAHQLRHGARRLPHVARRADADDDVELVLALVLGRQRHAVGLELHVDLAVLVDEAALRQDDAALLHEEGAGECHRLHRLVRALRAQGDDVGRAVLADALGDRAGEAADGRGGRGLEGRHLVQRRRRGAGLLGDAVLRLREGHGKRVLAGGHDRRGVGAAGARGLGADHAVDAHLTEGVDLVHVVHLRHHHREHHARHACGLRRVEVLHLPHLAHGLHVVHARRHHHHERRLHRRRVASLLDALHLRDVRHRLRHLLQLRLLR
eukprot:Rhum_TRINITY_DN15038_c11_g1::Rhum_TRINITY_DN15038_c11_g1_i1::g.135448::m.135448